MTDIRTRKRPGLARVLQAADSLFYGNGIQGTGVDLIASEASVSKATMYTYFRTKDDLVVDYLQRRSDDWRATLGTELEQRGGSARDQVAAVFDVLGGWFHTAGYRGCPFINAEAECGPDSPAHAVTLQHRQWVHELFRDLAERAGAAEPARVARRLSLIYDGAMSSAHSEPAVDWAEEAKLAAIAILDAS